MKITFDNIDGEEVAIEYENVIGIGVIIRTVEIGGEKQFGVLENLDGYRLIDVVASLLDICEEGLRAPVDKSP